MKLINGTQHSQVKSLPAWDKIGVSFDNPDFVPFSTIDPKKDIRVQAVAAWRALLAEVDRCFNNDIHCDGILLGGYAPIVLALYQYASQFRIPTYCAVMGQAPLIEGQRRTFVLSGVRRVPSPKANRASVPVEGQPLPPATMEQIEADAEMAELMPETPFFETFYLPENFRVTRSDRFVHVSSRGLSDAQTQALNAVTPQHLIAPMPALPPEPDASMASFQEAINDIVKAIVEYRAPVLFDGAPAETLLRLYSIIGHAVPCYYVKTEVTPATVAGGAAQHRIVGVEKVPRA